MPQTVGQIAKSGPIVEVSVDGTAWTDICGTVTTVDVGGGDRSTSETNTSCGEGPVVVTGKRAAQTVEVNSLYTEIAT